jgi:hypothetical protein
MEPLDCIGIARNVESFYLSSLQKSKILVNFPPPVNDNVYLPVSRKSSYQETLNNFMATVVLYKSTLTKISYNSNGVNRVNVSNGFNSRNTILNSIAKYETNKYFCENNYIGT